jgi:omega-6 fatty acid desaturase (delta-12 desaturase)
MNQTKQKELRSKMKNFEYSNSKKSVWQLINTLGPFILLWFFAYKCLSLSYFISLPISFIAAGFLLRIFIIFHDCCHHSFFKNRNANKIIGTITGVLTLSPYSQWQHSHNIHHATSGNLDKRGIGDIWMMTKNEYLSSSSWGKLGYRLYRNPFIMFLLGPTFVFLIQHRFNKKHAKTKERWNTYLTNFLIVLVISLLCLTIGWKSFLLIQLPIFLLSGTAGVWLFYVQHQFEDTYFEWDPEWEYVKAAVEGSSYYQLPKLFQWLSGNIGFHHVHHLSPRIPNYHLEKAHNDTDPLQNVPTINLLTSLKSLKFHLWDEDNKEFIGFKDVKRKKIKRVS